MFLVDEEGGRDDFSKFCKHMFIYHEFGLYTDPFYLFIYLSICISYYLCIYLSIYLFICLSLHPSTGCPTKHDIQYIVIFCETNLLLNYILL